MAVCEGVTKDLVRRGAESSAGPSIASGDVVEIHFKAFRSDTKALIDDTRAMGLEPFPLLIGRKFSMPAWEAMVKSMAVGEVARFKCDTKRSANYSQVGMVIRKMAEDRHKETCTEHAHDHAQDAAAETSCCVGLSALKEKHRDLLALQETPLEFEFELLEIKKQGFYKKERWQMTVPERLQALADLKDKGNELFKKEKVSEALLHYHEVLEHLELLSVPQPPAVTEEDVAKAKSYKLPSLLNVCACYLKLKKYSETVDFATKALGIDPKNAKALFRRAQAHFQRGRDPELAVADAEACLAVNPDDAAVKTLLQQARAALAVADKAQANLFSSMVKK